MTNNNLPPEIFIDTKIRLLFRITQVMLYRVFNIIYRHPLVFKLSKLYPIQENALKVMHNFTDDVIQKRRADLLTDGSDNNGNSGTDDSNAGDDVGIRKKRALLDILLQSTIDDKPLNDLDIREETDGFMFAVRAIFYI